MNMAATEYIIRKVISVKDSDYFCNRSWTLSFNVNTKSWISFHSYIPNWYIAENNFFYSGVNGCCEDFDFVAGTLIPNPTTTTTTTPYCNLEVILLNQYSTTTTTTSTEIIDAIKTKSGVDYVITVEGDYIITI